MYLYTARQMLCICLGYESGMYIVQYGLACYNLWFHTAKFRTPYSFGARGLRYSCLPNSDVAAHVSFL